MRLISVVLLSDEIIKDATINKRSADYVTEREREREREREKESVCVREKQRDTIQETLFKVRKRAKIRNRYNQAPNLTQDTNGKVTTSQLDITNKSQDVSPFQAGDLKASTNRRFTARQPHPQFRCGSRHI